MPPWFSVSQLGEAADSLSARRWLPDFNKGTSVGGHTIGFAWEGGLRVYVDGSLQKTL